MTFYDRIYEFIQPDISHFIQDLYNIRQDLYVMMYLTSYRIYMTM